MAEINCSDKFLRCKLVAGLINSLYIDASLKMYVEGYITFQVDLVNIAQSRLDLVAYTSS